MNRKAALLAGLDVQERELVDIDPAKCDPALWPEVVERINMSVSPPRLSYVDDCHAPTQAEVERVVRLAVIATQEEAAETQRKAAEYLAEYRAAWAALAPTPMRLYGRKDDTTGQWVRATSGLLVSEEGRKINPPSYCAYNSDAAKEAVAAEFATRLAEMTAAVARHNDEVFARDLPSVVAAEEARIAKEAEQKAAQKKAQVEANKIKFAERLKTGYWERETGSYNERKYSAPWCAKVTFPSGAKPHYEFGESTGKWGSEGLLRVQCSPGEIVAWGQKDLRRPGNSDHYLLIMRENGSMMETDKTEAFRHYKNKTT